tara:strand:+ start:3322 stop:4182 length:861 start_codon:yes stop_codon:yes gene_type:complete
MKKISIVIVSYKSDEVIIDCLLSIQKYADIPYNDFEVVIVDNYRDSKLDGLIKKVENEVDFHIEYVMNIKNGGFGQGNNVGVDNANGEMILFLNPDTILVEGILEEIYFKLKSNNTTVLGFHLIDEDYTSINSYSFFPELYFMAYFIFLIKKVAFFSPNRISFLNKKIWPWGAAFALEKILFLKSRGFDENIFLCNEEADLLRRIPNRKVFISDKKIIHLEGHSTVSSVERHIEYFKSTFYYLNKYKLNKKRFIKNFYNIYYIKKIFYLIDEDLENKIKALKRLDK